MPQNAGSSSLGDTCGTGTIAAVKANNGRMTPFDHGSSAWAARPPGRRAITSPRATPAIVACTPDW